jgi:TrmH family RNA methyltransferase
MLSKKEIKDIQSLSQKKFREETGLFIAEGPKIVDEFVQTMPSQIERIYATTAWIENNATVDFAGITEISEKELEKISQLKTPNQVLLVARMFENKEPTGAGFIIYLDTVQDPGNLGTIIRIADWFNVKTVVCSAGCADIYNPKVVQSTMASLARVKVFYDEDETWLNKQKLPVYAAALDGKSVWNHEKVSEGILLIGNESKGIRKEFMQLASARITIPRIVNAESLNAAVATGIILSHLLG